MSHRGPVALLLLSLCLLAAGCAKRETQPPPAGELLKTILDDQPFNEAAELSREKMDKYLDLAQALYLDGAMAMDSSRMTPECVVVLTARDAEALEALKETLASYLGSLKEQYRDYRPQEMPKLEAALLRSSGLQAALVVSPDADRALKILDEAWR